MDMFLETHSPLKLNQEETDNLNIPIIRSEIESFFFFFFFFFFLRAAPADSQARGRIRATAASLHHSHNMGYEPCL